MLNEKNKLNIEWAEKLKRLGTATLYEAQGATGSLDSSITPLARGMKLVGPAMTLQMRPGDNLMIHYALLHAKKGDVLVINCDGFTGAGIWGDVLTAQAQRIGLAGLVVNGAVRDSDAIIESNFPVFAKGLSIRGTEKKQPGKMNEPLLIGDCMIHPGDIIVGDSDGLVVIESARLEEVIHLSEVREEKENVYKEKISHGSSTAELMELSSIFKNLNLK
ncbi:MULTISPECIES: RraA family protein [Pectobacterium]|uniref:Putative 4-hydroxy-4-methyl-2-oxoglutarate aldolase n=1 Tax=Pectobacterium actinidiae TaxID=1507808 RepID=A0A1V2R1L6_9GAMM|nr:MULTISPECIES: RraA family protein [Pectobacterium]KHN90673.1 demethylmenaquinone methyltransferase [Pectobacterium actinidiae]MDY4314487.1 RraA family protein [Pectobacterium actinidiae]ONK02539.1 4-hydroxy-4-methyl-2-oxoglutarate aldolase [Pectobacterium actinidiae]ONK03843.1 4-hydroxy-4-methyl-2-oxoglutarate aldolase [Pectobacterium actinidiae]WEF12983.1 RraA family protein [Pectobacterium actinidiae]